MLNGHEMANVKWKINAVFDMKIEKIQGEIKKKENTIARAGQIDSFFNES